jgi:hypothetical protein
MSNARPLPHTQHITQNPQDAERLQWRLDGITNAKQRHQRQHDRRVDNVNTAARKVTAASFRGKMLFL